MKKLHIVLFMAVAMMAQTGFGQTVVIPGNAYAFQWSGDPDIGLYFSAANSRYEFRDLVGNPEWWCNPITGLTYHRNDVVIGAVSNSNGRLEVANAGANASAVAARGALGPTNGYLGAQGTTDFDGILSLDIFGEEVGVLGVSTGGSSADNSGVYGHSNGRGVYGEHSSSGYSAALGSATYAVNATGPSNLTGDLTLTGNTVATGNVNWTVSGSNTSSAAGPFQINNGLFGTAFDGNEVQSYVSGTAGGTWYANYWGGSVDLINPLSNPDGDLRVHNLLYVDGSEDNVGVGTSVPATIFEVQGRNETGNVATFDNGYVGTSDVRAIIATSTPNNGSGSGYGYGGQFTGGYRGVYGFGNGEDYGIGVRGVWGQASGTTGAGPRYGVYGNAFGGSTNYGVYASGDMAYTGTLTDVSDARFKQNIKDIENASELISKVKPRAYDLKVQEYDYMGFTTEHELGFVAQELEQVLPELVHNASHPGPEGPDGRFENPLEFKSVNYIGMIPVIVAAMQEQQEEIEAKDEAIEELKEQVAELAAMVKRMDKDLSACCTSSTSDVAPSAAERASLGQNVPNPFNGSTTINYYLPKDATFASIKVVDINGSIVKEFNLQGEGLGQVSFASTDLSAGNYFYSMQIDGEVIDTKQMSIVK